MLPKQVIHRLTRKSTTFINKETQHVDEIAMLASCKTAHHGWLVNAWNTETVPVHPRLSELHWRALEEGDEEALELILGISLLQIVGGVFLSGRVRCAKENASLVFETEIAKQGALLLGELFDDAGSTGMIFASAANRIEIDTLFKSALRPLDKSSKNSKVAFIDVLMRLVRKKSTTLTSANKSFELAVT